MLLGVQIFLVLISTICLQAEGAGPCVTAGGEDGKCVELIDCPPIRTIIHLIQEIPENGEYLLKSACRINIRTVGVCCPVASRLSPLVEGPVPMGYNLLTPPQCGQSLNNATIVRVRGGQPVKRGQFPWIATLGYGQSYNFNALSWKCSGALITNRHVLTAAHCVHGFQNELKIVRLDGGHLSSHKKSIEGKVVDVYIHENYDAKNRTNDIAILKLASEIQNDDVREICLPTAPDMREGTFLRYTPFIAGWELVNFNNTAGGDTDMLMTQVPIMRNDVCKRAYKNKSWYKIQPIIDDRTLCAGNSGTSGRDCCVGDSGGVLMLPSIASGGDRGEGDVRYFAIGVLSYNFKCGEPGFPNVYTRIGHYLPWIQAKLSL